MTIGLLALLLVLPAAQAEDDDGLLETPPLQGIPERMQELEREWADDVGLKEPVDPADEADSEEHEPPDAEREDEPESQPVKAPPDDEPARRPATTIRKPVEGESREPARKPSGAVRADDPRPSRAERRAIAEE